MEKHFMEGLKVQHFPNTYAHKGRRPEALRDNKVKNGSYGEVICDIAIQQ